MSSQVIAFAVWGNPAYWRLANYKSNGEGVKSFSTLEILSQVEKPKKVILIVSDTLALEAPDKITSYDDVVEKARSYAERYVCSHLDEFEIKVLPGVIRKNKGDAVYVFKADMDDFRSLALYEIYMQSIREDRPLELTLDISHGINYMPTLTYDSFREAAALYSVSRIQRTKIRVYQADPYPILQKETEEKLMRDKSNPCTPKSQDAHPPDVAYNLLLEENVYPWEVTRYIGFQKQKVKQTLNDVRNFPEHESVKSLIEELSLPLIGAYRLGAIVQLALLAKPALAAEGASASASGGSINPGQSDSCAPKANWSLKDIEVFLKRSIEEWRKGREPFEDGNEIIVESKNKFAPGFRALLQTHAILSGIKSLISTSELEMVTLTELKNLKKLYQGSKVVTHLLDREIEKLDFLKGKILEAWTPYYKYRKGVQSPVKKCDPIFKRDFIAHAGFHDEVIEVRKFNSEIQIRVRGGYWCCLKDILEDAVIT
ncbi:MAG: TM1812 family CRISPR-associated protein [Infirmifilum sp.]|uniref:TM1812 family CRISPR-associated protein n=1 Tax=Infirmifilum sp. TaxID=2856575 RepID=UPI003D11405E